MISKIFRHKLPPQSNLLAFVVIFIALWSIILFVLNIEYKFWISHKLYEINKNQATEIVHSFVLLKRRKNYNLHCVHFIYFNLIPGKIILVQSKT